ncbi:AGC protein kinase [Carpediemonas membranifera]|uniref:non-specific serine/threonine protein kinase n=1 Tax=Carpediemonas membranifera TaxID=201153 RepID=A0A8J6DZK0_9EUKA|nr:AGC protein kinase [Carpediemonas membranifera]|eukprot:KAG9390506.1 AGC protein kinase [Carpediemonas membranifera]
MLKTQGLPYCVKLVDYFMDDLNIYFVMELVPGGALFDHIQGHSLPVDWVRFYLAELLVALTGLHGQGIVHRDLKPENILLDGEGHVRLIDFGVSAELKQNANLITFCGTADYVSPECLHNRPYRTSVDWWAFGCIAYEMLVGQSPFAARSVHLTYQRILTRQLTLPDEMDTHGKDLVDRLLLSDPDARIAPDDIKAHPFFSGVCWDTLLSMQGPMAPGFTLAHTPNSGRSISPHMEVTLSARRWAVRDRILKDIGVTNHDSMTDLYPDIAKLPSLPSVSALAATLKLPDPPVLSAANHDALLIPSQPVTHLATVGDTVMMVCPFSSVVAVRSDVPLVSNALHHVDPLDRETAMSFDVQCQLPCTSTPYFGCTVAGSVPTFLFPAHRRVASLVSLDVEGVPVVKEWAVHNRPITCAASRHGVIATADMEGSVTAGPWDGQAHPHFSTGLFTVQMIDVSPNGSSVAVSDGSTVCTLNAATQHTVSCFEVADQSLAGLSYVDPNVFCVAGHTLGLLDARVPTVSFAGQLACPATGLAVQGNLVAVTSTALTMLFDVRSMAAPVTTVVTGYQPTGAVCAFKEDRTQFACSTAKGACLIDLETMERSYVSCGTPAKALAFTSNSLVQATPDTAVYMFDLT